MSVVFPSLEALLASRRIRRRADSSFLEDSYDLGCWWRDRDGGVYRLTWVGPLGRVDRSVEAGELYLVRLRGGRASGPGEAELLCVIPPYAGDDGEPDANVDAVLDGWADVCGSEGSVDWVRARVRVALGSGRARPATTGPRAAEVPGG